MIDGPPITTCVCCGNSADTTKKAYCAGHCGRIVTEALEIHVSGKNWSAWCNPCKSWMGGRDPGGENMYLKCASCGPGGVWVNSLEKLNKDCDSCMHYAGDAFWNGQSKE